MSIPQSTRNQIDLALTEYCRSKVPPRFAHKLRLGYTVRGNGVTLFEERPGMFDAKEWIRVVVAQFRHTPSTGTWSLHCADRNSRWHLYDDIDPTSDFRVLLDEVEADPTGIFWG